MPIFLYAISSCAPDCAPMPRPSIRSIYSSPRRDDPRLTDSSSTPLET